MITKYKDYINKLKDLDKEIFSTKSMLYKYEDDKEKLFKSLKKEFINNLTLELSKYYNEVNYKEIKKITGSHFWNTFQVDVGLNSGGGFLRPIKKVFLIDNNYAIALSYDDYVPYDRFKINAHKAYNNTKGWFNIYKKPFFTFSMEDDLESVVKVFSEKYNKSIRTSQKRRELTDNIKKYNL